MSYNLTTFSTVQFHDYGCKACHRCHHPSEIYIPQLASQLVKIRAKKQTLESKIMQTSFKVAEIESKIRECAQQRKEELKAFYINSLTVHAGYLHMLLRYSLILKQDTKRLHHLISHADGRPGHMPELRFSNQAEVNLAQSAPDLASLLIWDFYPPQDENAEEAEEEYSIIQSLFSSLASLQSS
jgi:hypothetical protein